MMILFSLIGAITAIFLRKKPGLCIKFAFFCAIISALFGLLCAITVFAGVPVNIPFFIMTNFGTYTFALDSLGAWFLLIIAVLVMIVSLYSLEYTKEFANEYSSALMGSFYNMFFLSMALVIAADNVILFLIAWESMSVISYFLVVYERKKKEAITGGLTYVIMMHVGTVFIMAGLFTMAVAAHSFNFRDLINVGAIMAPEQKNFVFIFLLIGFGMKAGIIPLHVWLPLAHPEAPSNVSALMSGVMIKTPVFLLIRITFNFLGIGGNEFWWGIVVMAFGCISAILGVLYANVEQDLKRLLAYHSVENIGIIFIGLGASILFQSLGLVQFASLALIGTLFHVLSHAFFKGLLFMGAGAILHATHTKNIEDLGGLAKLMPRTSVYFFFGVMSITALPPFNGFVSEWLIFQSLMLYFTLTAIPLIQAFIAVSIAILALSGGLAIACFVHTYGITFLATPRSEHARKATEVPRLMQGSMGTLAILCLATGLLSMFLLPLLDGVVSPVTGSSSIVTGFNWLFSVPVIPDFSGFSPALTCFVMLIVLSVMFGFSKIVGNKKKIEIAGTWDCGTPLNERNEYTATAFGNPINKVFTRIYKHAPKTETTPSTSPYIFKTKKYTANEKQLLIEKHFYEPIVHGVVKIAQKLKKLQSGSINRYLIYIFVVLILLLIFFR
nr:proton-conducting transporter membrane subunit [Candidatus Sigynarchaeota archaeon]